MINQDECRESGKIDIKLVNAHFVEKSWFHTLYKNSFAASDFDTLGFKAVGEVFGCFFPLVR